MAIADLLDGFAVEPDPQRMRSMRMIVIAIVVSGLAISLALAVVSLANRQPILLIVGLAYLLLIGPTSWAFWRTVGPPVLKADSMSVAYAYVRSRAGGWIRGYLFTVAGGKVAYAVPEVWFRPDDMAEFARLLGLPMRGDFSQRVRDVVSEGS